MFNNIKKNDDTKAASGSSSILNTDSIPTWEQLTSQLMSYDRPKFLKEQERLRAIGEGLPHTDAKIRLFGTSGEPRVILYRDTAGIISIIIIIIIIII